MPHHFHEKFLDEALDSTSTWQQIIDVAKLTADSLCFLAAIAQNTEQLWTQQWCYITVEILSEIYEEKRTKELDVHYSDIRPIIDRINDAASLWTTAQNDSNYFVVREHLYNCHHTTETPESGVFVFWATKPKYDNQEQSISFLFPKTTSAENQPFLIFNKYFTDRYSGEDPESEERILLPGYLSIATDDGMEYLFEDLDADIVDRMLLYDVMYIVFVSKATTDGIPEET